MAELCEVNVRLVRRRSSVPEARALLRAKLGEWRAGEAPADVGELVPSGSSPTPCGSPFRETG